MIIQNIIIPVVIERAIGICSAAFSLIYFIIAMAQLAHIVFNYYHTDDDWEAVPGAKHIHNNYKKERIVQGLKRNHLTDLKDGLHLWFWIGVIFILIWIIILPILHI